MLWYNKEDQYNITIITKIALIFSKTFPASEIILELLFIHYNTILKIQPMSTPVVGIEQRLFFLVEDPFEKFKNFADPS